jgi:hypothetical protein
MAIGLSACGGGGGGGRLVSIAPPPPPPPPTKICPDGSVIPATDTCPVPPPPSPNFVNIFPNITADTDFAVLGLQADALGIPAASLVSSGFSVRFDAASDAYVIDLPLSDPGKFDSYGGSSFWQGSLIRGDGTSAGVNVWIRKPADIGLAHTTFGLFDEYDGFYDYDVVPGGVFAFGTASPQSAVPTTGSAVFDAIVQGLALDTGNAVTGTASLQFNFGAGTLSGSLNPSTYSLTSGLYVSLGTYTFTNTVFGVGSTTFSGQLQHPGTSNLGAFNGLFTGPLAHELMAKWTAPYRNPDSDNWSEMFGVMVGKRP